MDMTLKGQSPSFEQLGTCHEQKTAALFAGSAAIGAWVGGGSEAQVTALRSFGLELGLAFQYADDLRDADFPEHKEASLKECVARTQKAIEIAKTFALPGSPLVALAGLVEQRAREAV
jgi:geranylgeranyl pyrophosphate synthase